ncbi:MAG: hypothetical protein NC229_08520 [Bacteroides sp.]|nr:hypothetical protein [Bacteroidales bacterium]MCM1068712.1 hypothetical protein [Prevotella sp.]MCM1354688.1 hypothetical protein [Bacteroides sp.]MCM1403764.1 hypothetical protein [Bacteroides sp.]MCM1443518.1 hypothetical protein [Muribaculum sp.]
MNGNGFITLQERDVIFSSMSHTYKTTDVVKFTRLKSITAGDAYQISGDISVQGNIPVWAESCCMVIANGMPGQDVYHTTIKQIISIYSTRTSFTAQYSGDLYIAYAEPEYIKYLSLSSMNQPEEIPSECTVSIDNFEVIGLNDDEETISEISLLFPTDLSPIRLFVDKDVYYHQLQLITEEGKILYSQYIYGYTTTVELFGKEMANIVELGQMFYIRIYSDSKTWYSQRLIRTTAEGFSELRYRCNEDTFSFPFHSAGDMALSMVVPILLSNPQFVQDDKTYEKANGEIITLYAKYYREWEGETEYISEAMHQHILTALSCDEVYINGIRITKTGNYQIEWDKHDIACDDKTKLARATFKARENIVNRNSNY